MSSNLLAKYLAEHDNMPQGQLAERLGVAQSMVADWANDRRRPNLINAIALEKETGVPASSWTKRTKQPRQARKSA